MSFKAPGKSVTALFKVFYSSGSKDLKWNIKYKIA